MLKVNIFDNTCSHHVKDYGYFTSTDKRKPANIEFVHKNFNFDGITLFTDDYILNTNLVDKVRSKLKVAWCLESPIVQYNVHNNLHLVEDHFDYILCYRQDLIKKNPKKYLPNSPGGTYILDNDIGLHENSKNKKCSMILSGKRSYPGHILRHQIQNSSVGIDCFGWGSPSGKIENKIIALKDYMFSITIENVRAYHYFTEKLIDCLLTGCVPVYYGAPNIGDYFNIKGFVVFNSLEELSQMKLSKKIFEEKKQYIEENFKLAHKYISSDDFLATKLIKMI
jgi:hypothetical protein